MESYLSTSKNQYASNVINKKEDTRYAEPDPSLRPFFQFLLNSTKRKKQNITKSSDSRLVENFINYSINNLQNPVHADSLDSIILTHNIGKQDSSYKREPETQYLPVPIYSKIPKPKPIKHDLYSSSDSISGSIYHTQTSTQDPYKNWQETPLIFPNSNLKPSTTRPPYISSNYYQPNYNEPTNINEQSPTFITPIELQAPTFITPIEYQGPTFVTPISVTQAPLSDGNPPPTIVILEDIDTAMEPPLSDPIVEQDPGSAGGSGVASAAAVSGAAGIIGATIGAGAGVAGIAGIAGGTAVAVGAGGTSGNGGGGGVVGGGGGGVVGTLTPADVAQCRAGGTASKVCSELITTSTSTTSSGFIQFVDDLLYLFTSFNFIGPLMITFWSIIFPPMSIILTSGLGVISFLFPWILPRIWFGRQLTHAFNINQFDHRFDNTNNYHQPYYY